MNTRTVALRLRRARNAADPDFGSGAAGDAFAGPPSVLIRRVSSDGNRHEFNRAWFDFIGTAHDVPLGMAWLERVHPDDRDVCRQRTLKAFAARRALEIEYRLQRHDGVYRRVFARSCPVWSAPGEFAGEVGICVEVSARRADERSDEMHTGLLSRQTRSLNLAHLIVCDAEGRIVGWHDGATQLYGYTAPQAWGMRALDLLQSELPEPLDQAFARFERDDRWNGEIVQRRRNGSRVVVNGRWEALRDAQGQLVQILMLHSDLAALNAADHALRAAEQVLSGDSALLRAVSENTRDPIYVKDRAGRILFANPAALRVLARDEADVLGRTSYELLDPADAALVAANDERLIQSGREIMVEETIHTPWGITTFLSTKSPLRNAAGEVVGLVGVSTDITDRKRAERDLIDSERKLRLITDVAPVGITRCSRDLRYLFVNRWYAEKFLGVPPEEAMDRPMSELMDPAGFEAIQPFIAQVLRGETVSYEASVRFGSARDRTIQVDYVPERNGAGEVVGWVAAIVDITDRRRAEGRLYQREREFETLVENAPDIIARLDRDLRHLYINRAVEPAFGVDREHFIGRTTAELKLPEVVVRSCSEAALAAFADGREHPTHFSLERDDGVTHHYAARAVPEFDRNGGVESVLMIVYNVTMRVNAQIERDELLEHERTARAEADAATHARDQFLAIVSHELRSPLNGIQSWAHVLESQLPEDAPRMRRALQGIRVGVEQQVRLIEDLLDATRIMSGSLSIVKQPVALLPVLEAALGSVREFAKAKRIAISTRYEIDGAQVDGDRDRLQQIVWNLLSNAVKFTPPEGRVELRASIDGPASGPREAVIVVRDSGNGIPNDFLPYMFDWFRRSEAASNRAEDGLGLGLALVRHLCQLHGGTVRVVSAGIGQGAKFTVRLPVRPAEVMTELSVVHGAIAASIVSDALQGVRVLLVDDQNETRDALTTVLVQYGAQVIALASGRDAVSWIESHASPDVLVCDIAMPDQDGHATLTRIREIEAERGVPTERRLPAIAMSAFTQREDRLRALATGFQVHIPKPLAPGELVVVIATLSGRPSAAFSSLA